MHTFFTAIFIIAMLWLAVELLRMAWGWFLQMGVAIWILHLAVLAHAQAGVPRQQEPTMDAAKISHCGLIKGQSVFLIRDCLVQKPAFAPSMRPRTLASSGYSRPYWPAASGRPRWRPWLT